MQEGPRPEAAVLQGGDGHSGAAREVTRPRVPWSSPPLSGHARGLGARSLLFLPGTVPPVVPKAAAISPPEF